MLKPVSFRLFAYFYSAWPVALLAWRGLWPCFTNMFASDAKSLPAYRFHDGSLLDSLAQEYAEESRGEGHGVLPFGGTGASLIIYWASICSGSEVVLFALLAMASCYRSCGVNVSFCHRFSCEWKTPKQQWIQELFKELGIAEGCLFRQAEDLGGEYAHCVRHGKNALFLIATSC